MQKFFVMSLTLTNEHPQRIFFLTQNLHVSKKYFDNIRIIITFFNVYIPTSFT